jgi:hypothetical protein
MSSGSAWPGAESRARPDGVDEKWRRLADLESGLSPPLMWGDAVDAQWARIEEVRGQLRQLPPYRHVSPEELRVGGRLMWEAHFLVIAIRHLLRSQEVYLKQTGDHRLAEARAAFDAAVPHAKTFRDFLEHLDKYLRDQGNLQLDGSVALGLEMEAAHERSTGRLTLRFGEDHELDLDDAADAALALAEVTAQVWFERGEPEQDAGEPDATPL